MDRKIHIEKNSPQAWPYVIAGAVIGGAVGFLFSTDTGQRIRRGVTHPDEMADDIEELRTFVESKAQMVTDQVHDLLQRAKRGIEQGRRAYEETGHRSHSQTDEFHGETVDNVSQTAVTIEQVVPPIVELGALFRGIEQGIRTAFADSSGRRTHRTK